MSLQRSCPGHRPGRPLSSRALAPALALAVVTALAGCAQNEHRTAAADPAVASPPYRVAGEPGARPDLEDDGREAQVPPLKRDRPVPDDPSQPWSPNYGTRPAAVPSRQAEAGDAAAGRSASVAAVAASASPRDLGQIVKGAVPDDLPPAFRRRLVSAMDE